jgi:tyrosinase
VLLVLTNSFSNVDRQIAIWQAIWPETWLSECFAETTTFTIPFGSVNSTTPLTPFHKDAAGTFWNSDHSRYIKNLGYTYPELANNPSHSSLISTVKKLYAGSATSSVSSNFRLTSAEESPRKYFVQVKLPAYGFHDDKDGSLAYNVLLFAGDVGNDAKKWATSESLVGLASTLGGTAMRQDLTITSLIDVTSRAKTGLEAEEVVKSLKDKLSYRLEIVSLPWSAGRFVLI